MVWTKLYHYARMTAVHLLFLIPAAIMQGRVKVSAVKSKVTFHCSRGPADNRDREAAATEKKDGKRIDRTALGQSCRVGCNVHFTAREQPDTEDITELLYYHADHSDACKVRVCACLLFLVWHNLALLVKNKIEE